MDTLGKEYEMFLDSLPIGPDYEEERKMNKEIRIIFDGPPGPESGRFVEVENEKGESICFGEWKQKCPLHPIEGEYWYLSFPDPVAAVEAVVKEKDDEVFVYEVELEEKDKRITDLEKIRLTLIELCGKYQQQIAALTAILHNIKDRQWECVYDVRKYVTDAL